MYARTAARKRKQLLGDILEKAARITRSKDEQNFYLKSGEKNLARFLSQSSFAEA